MVFKAVQRVYFGKIDVTSHRAIWMTQVMQEA
jgi:hypothetical protein